MKIEIELHEAESASGERVRIRIIREYRDEIGDAPPSVTLVRDHDSGLELRAGADGAFEGPNGERFTPVKRLA